MLVITALGAGVSALVGVVALDGAVSWGRGAGGNLGGSCCGVGGA